MADDLDRILDGTDPLAGDWGRVDHAGTLIRRALPRQLTTWAWRLRLKRAYRWLGNGRTGACSCGWRRTYRTAAQADHELAAHVYGRYFPLVAGEHSTGGQA